MPTNIEPNLSIGELITELIETKVNQILEDRLPSDSIACGPDSRPKYIRNLQEEISRRVGEEV